MTDTDILLDIYEHAERANEEMQEHWPALEAAIAEEICTALFDAMHRLELIEKKAAELLGGFPRVRILQNEREERGIEV